MPKQALKKIDPEFDLICDIEAFTDDPLGFVYYAFPWGHGELENQPGPDTWQADILQALGAGLITFEQALQIAVASGNDIGKTALIAWLILWAMSTREDTRGVVTANTDTQLRTKTWPELKKWHNLSINKHWFTVTATAIYSNDKDHDKTWRIDAVPWSENNLAAFAGLHNFGKRVIVLFDEASEIPEAVWGTADTFMLDSDTELIWIAFGNPTQNTGRFKDCFGRFKHRWTHRQIDSRECRIANKAKIAQWVEDYGLDSDYVKVHVRGMFPSLSVKGFFSVQDLDAAFGKVLRPEQFEFAPKILTIDPAWEGDDMLEIGLRQGLAFRILRTIPKNDNDIFIANLIAQIEKDEEADAVFIDAGYSTGIVSAGRTWGKSWQLVWFAGASTDPGCYNKRAQMALEGKKWLKEGGALADDKELYEDILSIETVGRTDGKIQLEAKKDIKKRLGRSPGKFDAWLLSFAFPVAGKGGGRALESQGSNHKSDYDPMEGET